MCPTTPFDAYKRPLKLADGLEVLLYLVRFDKHGGSKHADAVISELITQAAGYSDIFIFAHGWNNDWTQANNRYDEFFAEYFKLPQVKAAVTAGQYKPLVIGIIWPSAILSFGKSERGPVMSSQAQFKDIVDECCEALVDESEIAQLKALAQVDHHYMGHTQPEELADDADDDVEDFPQGDVDELGRLFSDNQFIQVCDSCQANPALAIAASQGGHSGPKSLTSLIKKVKYGIKTAKAARRILRLFTVLIMKDRAGLVGYAGVARVLQALLEQTQARVHLLGHSYGTKVVLSALSATKGTRNVHSALLLQPAISSLAFADKVPGRSGSGGYRDLLGRVETPIFATFSAHDIALHKIFHRVAHREKDLGELNINEAASKYMLAAVFKLVSSLGPKKQYRALGGYGPKSAGERHIPFQKQGVSYKFDDRVRIYGLNGGGNWWQRAFRWIKKLVGRRTDPIIARHGDIASIHTAWALHSLVEYKRR